MTTSATAAPAVRAAFTSLVDYAGLFPPAKLEMAAALAEYAEARDGRFAWMLGRFIVPASRIPELLQALPETAPVPLSVIVDPLGDAHEWLRGVQHVLADLASLAASETRVRVEALEIALPALRTMRESYDAAIGQFAAAVRQAGLESLPAFVELPRDDRWRAELEPALFALSRHRLGAKLRCGGVVAPAFPSAEDVAFFIRAALEHDGLAIKATAGLHHPIRHRDERIGAMMHGFVNLLAAVTFARGGMGESDAARVLACEDPGAFRFDESGLAWENRRSSVEDLRKTREQRFISYGSCSFEEPTSDLQGLGLL